MIITKMNVQKARNTTLLTAVQWLILKVYICVAIRDDFGPYKQVYPRADLQQDPRNCSLSENGTCPLYFALMMAFDGDYITSGVIPGIQVAIDEINNDPSMLPGYTLHYTLMATRCETYGTTALDAMYTELLQPPTKVGIIGSGCSLATEPTAQVSHYYNITHISCVSSSEELSNRTRFRNYFQLLPTDADLAYGFFGIIMRFKWKRVAILVQEERIFQVTMDRLIKMLKGEKEHIQIRVDHFLSSAGISGLGDKPFDPEYRIFIFAMYSNHARRLLCEASKRDIQYPRNQLLLFGWYDHQWWIGNEDEEAMLRMLYGNSCSVADRERVIGPALAPIVDEFVTDCSKEVESGTNGFKFQESYETKFNKSTSPPLNLQSQTLYAQQCYDATWILAKALDHTIRDIDNDTKLRDALKSYEPDLNISTSDFNLQHFSYKNLGILNLIFGHLNRTNYSGLTGDVHFKLSNGLRTVDRTIIYQYQPTDAPESTPCSSHIPVSCSTIRRKIIGRVSHHNLSLSLTSDEHSLWSAGVPYDGEPMLVIVTVHPMLTAFVIALTAVGATFGIACMIFNFVYRNRRLIRLSSPKLNYLIGAGAIVLYIDVCFFVIPSTDQFSSTIYCNITPWLTAIGYSLCYGTIIVKMFRVFYIIRNLFTTKRSLKDLKLALAVAVLVLIDVIILLVYTVVEGLKGNLYATIVRNEENPSAEIGARGITHHYNFYSCDSLNRDITLGVLLGYKTILQIIAFVLTFSIQKVKLKGLNDAKYIAVAVYVTNFVTAIAFVTLYSLKRFQNLYVTMFSLSTLCGTTAILALIFIPKMIGLHRDPRGKTLFRGRTFASSSTESLSQGNQSSRENYVQQIETLRRRVRELESLLNQPCNSTQSPCEREFRLESINPCCMQQEGGGGSAGSSESAPFTGDEPANDDMEPTEMVPPGEYQEIGADSSLVEKPKVM